MFADETNMFFSSSAISASNNVSVCKSFVNFKKKYYIYGNIVGGRIVISSSRMNLHVMFKKRAEVFCRVEKHEA